MTHAVQKIREALTAPASHRLQLTSPVPTACQPFSGVTPEVRLTSSRRPRARAFESATLAGGLAPPQGLVSHAPPARNRETSFAQNLDNVDNLWQKNSGGACHPGVSPSSALAAGAYRLPAVLRSYPRSTLDQLSASTCASV